MSEHPSGVNPADYFTAIKSKHTWSGVKLDFYDLKFFTRHVLGQL